jgi:hypothetical protein
MEFHKHRLAAKGFLSERQIKLKCWLLTNYLLEAAFTGYVIHYTLTNFNWISMGIASALAMYYIEWFVKLVKRKEE